MDALFEALEAFIASYALAGGDAVTGNVSIDTDGPVSRLLPALVDDTVCRDT